jgi:hypothetical protein
MKKSPFWKANISSAHKESLWILWKSKVYYSINMFQILCIYQVHNIQTANKRHFIVYGVLCDHTFLTNVSVTIVDIFRVKLLQEYKGTIWLVVSSVYSHNFTLKMAAIATETCWQVKCDQNTSQTLKWILLVICILCLLLCSQQPTTCFIIRWWIVHAFLSSFLLRSIIISFHLLLCHQSVFILNGFTPTLVTEDRTCFRIVTSVKKHFLH